MKANYGEDLVRTLMMGKSFINLPETRFFFFYATVPSRKFTGFLHFYDFEGRDLFLPSSVLFAPSTMFYWDSE